MYSIPILIMIAESRELEEIKKDLNVAKRIQANLKPESPAFLEVQEEINILSQLRLLAMESAGAAAIAKLANSAAGNTFNK